MQSARQTRTALGASTSTPGTTVTSSLALDGATAASVDSSARVLETLLGNLDGMVYRCRDDADWTMEFVSQGCVRVTGYAPSDLLLNNRVSYEEITHPDDRERVRAEVRAAIEERRRFDIEYRIRHASGEIRWVWEHGIGIRDADDRLVAIEGLIEDVTERKRAEEALREAERRYRSLFDNAIEGIFRTTPSGRYIDANPALARIYGYDSPEELIASLQDIGRQLYVEPERRAQFMQMVKARGSVSNFESRVYRKNGDVIWISENARAVLDDHGQVVCYEGTVEDVTERKLYQARIERQANYDTLTGLANRSLLHDRLQQAILTAASYGTRLAVVFVDLDRFKLINDSLGHHVGDELLRVMAKRLKACVREFDTVARLGGDEFVLLVNGHSHPDSIAMLMKRTLEVVSQPWRSEAGDFHVTCSIGVAVYPDDGADATTLLKHADSAMYRAKEQGRGIFQFYTADLNVRIGERLELESNLRRALARGQLELDYQPRYDLGGAITGCEALIRWRWPGRGVIEPARFIPIAEEIGLISEIGRWVLKSACAQNKSWQDAGLPPIVVSVNVSPRQFRRGDLVSAVADALVETGLDPRWLEIEITEGMMMHDREHAAEVLRAVKALGVQIAVDDFGTGYSSLSYLKRFPVDRLKIDRSFVQDISASGDDATIVRAIVALGHNLGLKVVAEGVETDAQVRFLREQHCDELQGYLLSRPVPPERMPELIRAAAV